jgi:hypothetical protein
MVHKERVGIEGSDWAVYAAWQNFFGSLKKLLRFVQG